MKILFNATTNVIGGGVKNSAIFIKRAVEEPSCDWTFAVSDQVFALTKELGVDPARTEAFSQSPARCKQSRRRLLSLAENTRPDLVYTMAGPAYVRFPFPHVLGLSNPYVTHADLKSIALGRTIFGLTKTIFESAYKLHQARRADFWIFQTQAARDGFCRRAFISPARTEVVSNAVDTEFVDRFERQSDTSPDAARQNGAVIFVPAAPYRHKALTSIPSIARELDTQLNGRMDFRFVLTIDPSHSLWGEIESKANKLGVKHRVVTGGAYSYLDAASRYSAADIVFIPSILETFSVTFLETFASSRPLVAADRAFARDICGDAARYVDPFCPGAAAATFKDLLENIARRNLLVRNGRERLMRFPDHRLRFENIMVVLKTFAG